MKYNYYYDEWSQDTRKYKVESDLPLTRDEIIHMASSCKIVDGSTYSDVDKNAKVTFRGTEYGDDTQTEITGDWVKEDDELESKKIDAQYYQENKK